VMEGSFVAFAQLPELSYPGKASLNDPAPGKDCKACGLRGPGRRLLPFSDPNPFSRALDGLHLPSGLFLNPGSKIGSTLPHVFPNQLDVGMFFLKLGQQQFRPFSIGNICCVNLDFQRKSQGIYQDMPLATVFCTIKAMLPTAVGDLD